MSEEVEFLQELERRLLSDLLAIRNQIKRISPNGGQDVNPAIEQFAFLLGLYDTARDKRKAIEAVSGQIDNWSELWKERHANEQDAYRALMFFVEQEASTND